MGLYNIPTKNNTFYRDVTKERRFRLLGVGNCGKVNIWGILMEDKGYADKVCNVDSSAAVISRLIRV